MSDKTFFFYDLETSGRSARKHVIMQFAGQRTDMDLNPIGEPINFYIKPSDDVLPEPEAVLLTSITPQKAAEEGITEQQAASRLLDEVCTPGTIMVGFNNARFDNEFLRFFFWRNFVDPYAWGYADGCSSWDVIDLMRMARALRPADVVWPEVDGKPSTKLEELSKANGIEHEDAHDAMSDVNATIEITRKIKTSEPKLFTHLLELRTKAAAQSQLQKLSDSMFVHSSGQISTDFLQTSVFAQTGLVIGHGANYLAWDLRYDPADFAEVDSDEVSSLLFTKQSELEEHGKNRLPIKGIRTNKMPAIAPVAVIDEDGWKRIGLTLEKVEQHRANLDKIQHLLSAVEAAYDSGAQFAGFDGGSKDKLPSLAESQLYDGFTDRSDRQKAEQYRERGDDLQADELPHFDDDRLNSMLPRYVMRNFPDSADDRVRQLWEDYRQEQLTQTRLQNYAQDLQRLAGEGADKFLLQELALWLESIVPEVGS